MGIADNSSLYPRVRLYSLIRTVEGAERSSVAVVKETGTEPELGFFERSDYMLLDVMHVVNLVEGVSSCSEVVGLTFAELMLWRALLHFYVISSVFVRLCQSNKFQF